MSLPLRYRRSLRRALRLARRSCAVLQEVLGSQGDLPRAVDRVERILGRLREGRFDRAALEAFRHALAHVVCLGFDFRRVLHGAHRVALDELAVAHTFVQPIAENLHLAPTPSLLRLRPVVRDAGEPRVDYAVHVPPHAGALLFGANGAFLACYDPPAEGSVLDLDLERTDGSHVKARARVRFRRPADVRGLTLPGVCLDLALTGGEGPAQSFATRRAS